MRQRGTCWYKRPERRIDARRMLALMTLAAGCWTTAGAQELRGTTTAQGQAAPIAGATIVLVDSAGRMVAGTLSDRAGRYVVRTAEPGTYRVRVRRLGFAPDTSRVVVLARNASMRLDAALRPVASLNEVVVQATRSCEGNERPDAAAARIWEATQGALTATMLTAQSARVGFVVRRHEREVDAASRRVIREQSAEARITGSVPYASVSADSLAAHGFVRTDTSWSTYYAPDAGTLVSDSFVAAHCFHAVQDAAHPELVGLAFLPSRSPTGLDDVAGTLWVDRATSELRVLEFNYRRPGRALADDLAPSGRVEYRDVPGVGWIVSRWQIVVPIARAVRHRVTASGETIGSRVELSTRTTAELDRTFEVGGEVLSTFPTASGQVAPVPRGTLAGRLVEEGTGRPIREGMVRLTRSGSAEPITSVTDSVGVFHFDSLAPGTYRMQAGESAESLSASSAEGIAIADGMRVSTTLSVPASPTSVSALCPAGLARGTSLLRGRVTEGESDVVAGGVSVRVRWSAVRLVRDGEYSVTPEQLVTTASATGRYAICNVPREVPLFVSVTRGGRRGEEVRTQIGATPAVVLDLRAP